MISSKSSRVFIRKRFHIFLVMQFPLCNGRGILSLTGTKNYINLIPDGLLSKIARRERARWPAGASAEHQLMVLQLDDDFHHLVAVM